jgi:hypothetical protein
MAFALTAAIWGAAWIMRNPEVAATRRPWALAAWASLALGCALAVWFHDTSAIPVTVLGVVALAWLGTDRRRRKDIARRAGLAAAAIVVLLLPAAGTVIDQADSVVAGFWIPTPTARFLLEALNDALVAPVGGGPLALALFLAVAALGAFRIARAREWPLAALLPVVLGASFTIELAISLLLAPIIIPRVLIWMGPSLAVLLAAAVSHAERRAVRLYAAAALTAVLGSGVVGYHLAYVKEPWRELVAVVTTAGTPGDAIVLAPGYDGALTYYLRDAEPPPAVVRVPYDPKAAAPYIDLRRADADAFRALAAEDISVHPRLWLIEVFVPYPDAAVFFRHVTATLLATGRHVTGTWAGKRLKLYRLE